MSAVDQAAPELHRLKIDAQPMSDLLSGNKTCEVRNDDRGFTVGDYVHLVCADGRETDRIISHIQRGYGLPDGLCVLSYHADLAAPSAPACYTVKDCLIDVSGANYRAIAKDGDGNLLGENDTGEHIMFSSSHVHLEGLHILSPEALENVISNRISELSAPAEIEGLVERLRVKGRMDREQINHHIRRMEVERIEAATALTERQAEIERLRALNERLQASADQGWAQVQYWVSRYSGAAGRRDAAESERDAWKVVFERLAGCFRPQPFGGDYLVLSVDVERARADYAKLKGEV